MAFNLSLCKSNLFLKIKLDIWYYLLAILISDIAQFVYLDSVIRIERLPELCNILAQYISKNLTIHTY